jgi:hypothetical protein
MSRVQSYTLNATNVHITVNGHYLDEAVAINAQESAQHTPAYGYMDVDMRRPLLGRRMVVGTIGIHYRAFDYFFRFLAATVTQTQFEKREELINRLRSDLRAFEDEAELLAYIAGRNLNSKDADLLIEAVERNSKAGPNVTEGDEILPNYKTPDVVGPDGFRAGMNRTSTALNGRAYAGHTIRIYYGDSKDEQFAEAIHGVTFTGVAGSPLENSAQVSANPAMKYIQFFGARIDPAAPIG